jgi:hypothetical protein
MSRFNVEIVINVEPEVVAAADWAIYIDDRGYHPWHNEGSTVDLGGKVKARRLKAYLPRSLAERLAGKYNRQMQERRKREEGTI